MSGASVKSCPHLVCHLQRLSTLDEDAVLGAHPCAHHDGRGGGQAQGARAGDAQHRDGGLEGKTHHHLRPRDALVVALRDKTRREQLLKHLQRLTHISY